jgi:hypothetical protein
MTLVFMVFMVLIKRCSGRDHSNDKEMDSMDITTRGVKIDRQDCLPSTALTSSIGNHTSAAFTEEQKTVGFYVHFLSLDRTQAKNEEL